MTKEPDKIDILVLTKAINASLIASKVDIRTLIQGTNQDAIDAELSKISELDLITLVVLNNAVCPMTDSCFIMRVISYIAKHLNLKLLYQKKSESLNAILYEITGMTTYDLNTLKRNDSFIMNNANSLYQDTEIMEIQRIDNTIVVIPDDRWVMGLYVNVMLSREYLYRKTLEVLYIRGLDDAIKSTILYRYIKFRTNKNKRIKK